MFFVSEPEFHRLDVSNRIIVPISQSLDDEVIVVSMMMSILITLLWVIVKVITTS